MLGPQTQVVDGQRFALPTGYQYSPLSYGAQSTGVPQVSPTMPPFLGSAGGAAGIGAAGEDVGGYGTAGNNAYVSAIAANNPHNLKVSPTWWTVAALIVGLVLLRAVHWRKTVLEGGEDVRVLGASESARAEA